MEAAVAPAGILTFDEAAHRYYLDGMELPGVTSILRPLNSFAQIPADILEAARQRGTAVHAATELDDAGQLDEESVHPLVRPYLDAWRRFRDDKKPEVLAMEHRVFSQKYRYAGTLDRVLLLDGEPALVDIKTGQPPATVGLQLAAYLEAWHEFGGARTLRRFVVHLRDDGTYRLIPCTNRDDFRVFLSALTLHNWRMNNER